MKLLRTRGSRQSENLDIYISPMVIVHVLIHLPTNMIVLDIEIPQFFFCFFHKIILFFHIYIFFNFTIPMLNMFDIYDIFFGVYLRVCV